MEAAFSIAIGAPRRFCTTTGAPMTVRLLRRFFGLILLLSVGTAGGLHAQSTTATVAARVVEPTGAALPGANVVLRNPATGARQHGTSTDSTGAFALRGVAPGRYRLRVSFVGYTSHTDTLTLRAGDTVRDTIALRPQALAQNEVVVTTRRAEPRVDPVTVSNLPSAEIDRRLGVQDVPSLLEGTPSTTSHSQNGNGIGYSTLRIRGFDQRRLAVSINGVPQNDPEDFNVFWANLYGLQSSIEDIQVQRGAGSSQYGSVGIGGAINIVTDPFEPTPYLRVRTGAGSFDTQRYSVTANSGLLGDRYVLNARFSRVTSNGYRRNAWAEFNRFFGGIARYGDRSTLKIQAFAGIQQDGLAFSGIPKAANDNEDARRQNPSADSDDQEWFHPPQVHLNHKWDVSSHWTLDQTAFWIKGKGYFDTGASFRSANFLRLQDNDGDPLTIDGTQITGDDLQNPVSSFGAADDDVLQRGWLDQNQFGWIPTVIYDDGPTETTLGIEARLHRSRRWGHVKQIDEATIRNAAVGENRRLWDARAEKIIASAFASHRFRPLDPLSVTADLQLTWRRYRLYDEKTFGREDLRSHRFEVPYVFLNPRLGATLYPDEPLSAYASVALAHREPRRTQLYDISNGPAGAVPQFERRADGSVIEDEPLIEPERLVDVELGGSWEQSRYRLSANLFWMEFWDEIVPSGAVNEIGQPRTGNADRTRHVGLELEGTARLLPGWTVSGNAMLARTRFVNFTEFKELETDDGKTRTEAFERDGNPIAASPEQLATLRTAYEWRGLTTALNVKAVGKQYVDNSGGTAASLENGNVVVEESDNLVVDPYALLGASVTYEAPASSSFDGLEVQLTADNLLDSHVLQHGFRNALGQPRFYPAATRSVFVELRYTLR
jgi:iron complex outermembrane receptor protein